MMADFYLMISVLAVIVFGAISGMLHRKRQVRLNGLRAQFRSFATTSALKQLLMQLQQHRGMISAFLNGDTSFRYKIPALQAEIDSRLSPIAADLKKHATHSAAFGVIQSEWRSIQSAAFRLDKEQSFERHCDLIAKLLNLIRDVAEYNQLQEHGVCSLGYLNVMWHLLPDAAEAIGQARGIGTGMAASSDNLVTDRIKLGFLVTRIRQTIRHVQQAIVEMQSASVNAFSDQQQLYIKADASIAGLIEIMETQLLDSSRPAIDPAHFFQQASTTVNHVFELYDRGETFAEDELKRKLAEAEKRQLQLLGNWLLMLVATVWLLGFGF